MLVERHADVVLECSTDFIVLERDVAADAGTTAALHDEDGLLDRTIGLQSAEPGVRALRTDFES